MAITRAQIAKQLLAQGGRTGLKGGADAATESFAESLGGGGQKGKDYAASVGARPDSTFNPGTGGGGPTFGDTPATTVDKDIVKQEKTKYEKQFFDRGIVPPLGSRPTSFKTKLNQRNLQKRLNYINYLKEQINKKLQKGLMDPSIPGVDVMTEEELLDLAPSVADLVAKGFYKSDGQFAKGEKIPDFPSMDMPGSLGIVQDIFAGPVTSDKLKELSGQLKTLEGLKTSEGLEGTTFKDLMKEYQPNRFEREYGDPKYDDRGPSDPCRGPNPPAYCFTGIRSAAIEPEEEVFTPNLRLLAEGGMADIDREAFLLGGIAKGLKKAVRAVKKIAKSPIGKAAILGAIGFGIPGVQSGFFSKGLMGTQKGLGFKKFLGDTLFGKVTDLGTYGPARNARVGGLLNSPLALIGGASALAGLMTKKDEDDEEELYAGADIDDPRKIMANPYNYLNIRNMAEGGSTEKEPVAKKTMPLLDMDGMEKDYREEGGFVPIGRMEKADDVPARLSKNEFVFTADAVRNAGDGDVDKGAEVMYNMMKNLESGGDVSEESQGLEGAREMFQTSKRLEEVL